MSSDHIPSLSVDPVVPLADAARASSTASVSILSVAVPSVAYELVDVDTGSEFCSVRPQDALPVILSRGRTPSTNREGVALVTQRPDMLRKNKCFSLLASRCGDKRVPAIWLSGGAPKLGWCWDGNPHTWLGSASVGARIEVTADLA